MRATSSAMSETVSTVIGIALKCESPRRYGNVSGDSSPFMRAEVSARILNAAAAFSGEHRFQSRWIYHQWYIIQVWILPRSYFVGAVAVVHLLVSAHFQKWTKRQPQYTPGPKCSISVSSTISRQQGENFDWTFKDTSYRIRSRLDPASNHEQIPNSFLFSWVNNILSKSLT